MGLGTGVRVGGIPHFPYPLLDSPLPASHPFPPTFFFLVPVEGLLSGKDVSILCFRREKKRAESGEKRKNATLRDILRRERSGSTEAGRNKSGREGGISDAVALSSHPPPPPFHSFVLSHEPRFRAMACAVQQHHP